jgi:hypothetical protein
MPCHPWQDSYDPSLFAIYMKVGEIEIFKFYKKKPGIGGTINRLHAHSQRTPTRIKPDFYNILYNLHLIGMISHNEILMKT